MIQEKTLRFLSDLSVNNHREWFAENKGRYEAAKGNAEAFMDDLIEKMRGHDKLSTVSGKKSLYRIYKDVRFSKDKTPYGSEFNGYLKRLKPALRGGYFLQIRPGNTTISCGFPYPNPEDLKKIRNDISRNYDDWKKLLNKAAIKSSFGHMAGQRLTSTPRGFGANDPATELLRHKQFLFIKSFTDAEVVAIDFAARVNSAFKSIRPFFDYMSEMLTTDANGESILQH